MVIVWIGAKNESRKYILLLFKQKGKLQEEFHAAHGHHQYQHQVVLGLQCMSVATTMIGYVNDGCEVSGSS